MKIVIMDGQGGKLGKLLIEKLKAAHPKQEVFAIGTNSIATAAMLKAGADFGATGENPVLVNCRDADVILGPLGICVADSLLGEITPKMAEAVGKSAAEKLLIPSNRCNLYVVGAADCSFAEACNLAMVHLEAMLNSRDVLQP